MGKKLNCFSSVKKALSRESKDKKGQKENKSKKKWFGKEKSAVAISSQETVSVSHPLPPPKEVKLVEVEHEQNKLAYSNAAEPAIVAVQAVGVTPVTQFAGKSKEEVAVIRIQAAFRGYLARRALRALRGLVRLKLLVQGPNVKRQTANTLRCMQTLAHVQYQVQSRRLRMSEENQVLQRQLLQKRAKELESVRIEEDWDDSLQSKEKIEANLLSKYEAAMRRERALAYSFSHQQNGKKSTRSANLLFTDPNNPHWGWSWLERWMAARSWETRALTEKEHNNDHSSVKSAALSISGGEIIKSYARHQLNYDKPSPTASQKTSHPSPFTPLSKKSSRKLKPTSSGGSALGPDDETKSIFSVQSERNRRHSIAGSSVRDDESLASSPSVVPSYMVATESAKAKSRMQSPLGMENGTPEKGLAGSTKKRLSFPSSPATPAKPRRHSGPPKVDMSSLVEHNKSNGVTSS